MRPSGAFAAPKIDVYGDEVKKSGSPLARIFFNTPLATDPTLHQTDQLLLNWNRENPQEAYGPQEAVATLKGPAGKDGKPGANIPMTTDEAKRYRITAGRLASVKLRGVVNAYNVKHPATGQGHPWSNEKCRTCAESRGVWRGTRRVGKACRQTKLPADGGLHGVQLRPHPQTLEG